MYDIIIIHTANLRPTESNQQKAWLLYKNDMNQVHLIIVREWPRNNPLILKYLDNFLPGAFYSTLCHSFKFKVHLFSSHLLQFTCCLERKRFATNTTHNLLDTTHNQGYWNSVTAPPNNFCVLNIVELFP